jgi:hypothetical protein
MGLAAGGENGDAGIRARVLAAARRPLANQRTYGRALFFVLRSSLLLCLYLT